ncbi:enoyl-CoA hydratase/isomerase family protein [Mumia sp. DW29H23]|uniref:enoyl-CoA hydratase/isomerase family protein n=1 Tax=Mumia sp. DW29H23 TaxID=3421241 RepID=UPI003D69F559
MSGGDGTAPDVLVERQGSVMVVTLNRPERHNAIGGTMLEGIAEAFAEAAADDAVRVVVTTGAGSDFCVGADADDLGGAGDASAREILSGTTLGGRKGLPELTAYERSLDDLGNAGRWTERIWRLEKPTIAAVSGVAVGGGFGIALLHDLIVADPAARLGAGFAPIGLAPELGISLLLPRVAGLSVAADLLFTGRLVDAVEAKEIGLVNRISAEGRSLDAAMTLADRVAAMPPLGLRAAKRVLRRSMTSTMVEQLREEHAAQLVLFDHPDTHEAFARLSRRLSEKAG